MTGFITITGQMTDMSQQKKIPVWVAQ